MKTVLYIAMESKNNELTHYGVKGMKWHEHRKKNTIISRNPDGSVKSIHSFIKGKPSYIQTASDVAQHVAKNKYPKQYRQIKRRKRIERGKALVDSFLSKFKRSKKPSGNYVQSYVNGKGKFVKTVRDNTILNSYGGRR